MLLHVFGDRLHWPEAARVLDLPCTGDALPQRLPCPACGGRLGVYHDTITHAPWHHCADCRKGGDIFQLAGLVWGLDHRAAVTRMARLRLGDSPEVDAEIAKYFRTYARADTKAHGIWDRARARLLEPHSPELAALRSRLYLRSQADPAAWAAGPGRLVGSLRAKEYAEMMRSVRGPSDGQGCELFPGAKWRDILIFPHYGAPGRIVGFRCVGRQAATDDWPYHGLYGWGHKESAPQEAGLAGLESVAAPHPDLGPHVIAIENPAIALRLQIRNMPSSKRLLPVVSWYHGRVHRTRSAWDCLNRREVVFWAWRMTAELIAQARLCDGRISLSEIAVVDDAGIDRHLRDLPPRAFLLRVVRNAAPWRRAVRAWAEDAAPEAIEEVLERLEGMGEPVLEIAQEMGGAAAALAAAPRRRVVQLGKHHYIENGDRWEQVPGLAVGRTQTYLPRRTVSDAVLRIDRVETGAAPRYFGRVLFAGGEVPLECTENDVRAAMVTACLRGNLGRPRITAANARMLDLALAFQPPRVLVPVENRNPTLRGASIAPAAD